MTMYFWENCGRALKLWARRVVEYLELNELLWKIQVNAESNIDDGGLPYKISEGNLRVSQRLRTILCLN